MGTKELKKMMMDIAKRLEDLKKKRKDRKKNHDQNLLRQYKQEVKEILNAQLLSEQKSQAEQINEKIMKSSENAIKALHSYQKEMIDLSKNVKEFNALLEDDPGQEVIEKLRQIPEKIKKGVKRKVKPSNAKSKRAKCS